MNAYPEHQNLIELPLPAADLLDQVFDVNGIC